jgi:hypothetical protein
MVSTFTGSAVNSYVQLVIAKALDIYADTGMKVNRQYTPAKMMAMATKITGKKFKARDYKGAAKALRDIGMAIDPDTPDMSATVN